MLLQLDEYLKYASEKRGIANTTLQNYQNALSKLNIQSIDTDQLPTLWQSLNDALETRPYGYITIALTVLEGCLHINDVEIRGKEYRILKDSLANYKNSPKAYSEKEVRDILKAANGNYGLYRTLVFLMYSGARIGAAEGLAPTTTSACCRFRTAESTV